MKKSLAFVFCSCLFSTQIFAKTEVIFFGGYLASPSQMSCWLKGAKENTAENRGYTYRAIPWPTGTSSGPSGAVLSGGRSTLAKLAAEIAANPDTNYIIAGHSSGAALANELARQATNPTRIKLIALDGFAPDSKLQKRVHTSCWYAEKRNDKGKVTSSSRNASSMKNNCSRSHAFINRTCNNNANMCLHFSLVNKRPPLDLSSTSFAKHGYDSCQTNLTWLPEPVDANSQSIPDSTNSPSPTTSNH